MRGPLVSAVINVIRELARDRTRKPDSSRLLYVGIVLSHLLKNRSQPFLNHLLAQSMMIGIPDLFVREETVGARNWTVVLNLDHRVTISISPLDDTPETDLASFALAMFIKAFEAELRLELIGDQSAVDELPVYVGHVDTIPEDVRHLIDQGTDLTEIMTEQSCVVTRPTYFDGTIPTYIFLSPGFSDAIALGEGCSGSLQELFGRGLVEVTCQLLGQVETDVIQPKVVSLVRKTMY